MINRIKKHIKNPSMTWKQIKEWKEAHERSENLIEIWAFVTSILAFIVVIAATFYYITTL